MWPHLYPNWSRPPGCSDVRCLGDLPTSQVRAGLSSVYSMGHGKKKMRLVVSFASGAREVSMSADLAFGWVLPPPYCVTLARHFPSLGLSFHLCRRKLIISASLTSASPHNSLLREYILLFKACASAHAIPTPWNAVSLVSPVKILVLPAVVLVLLLL